jgi:hypothetical protein
MRGDCEDIMTRTGWNQALVLMGSKCSVNLELHVAVTLEPPAASTGEAVHLTRPTGGSCQPEPLQVHGDAGRLRPTLLHHEDLR